MFAERLKKSDRTTIEGVTILDPTSGYATTLNTYTVTPEHVEEVLEYLIRSTKDVVRHQPGFVSFNFHVSADRTQIVNYGQWENPEALDWMRQDVTVATLVEETAKVAGLPCELNSICFASSRQGRRQTRARPGSSRTTVSSP